MIFHGKQNQGHHSRNRRRYYQAAKALEGVNKNIKNTQTQLKDVEKLLKLDPTNTELLSQKQRLLADAVSSTNDKLETLKKASEQAAKTKDNYDAWKAKYDPIKQKIGETETKLKDLKEQAKTADEQLSKGEISEEKYDSLRREIVETQQELQNLQREAENSRTALVKIGEAAAAMEKGGDKISGAGEKLLPLIAGIMALGTMAVKTTADFDAVMSKVSAVSGATGEDLDALRAKTREMGSQTKFSASEAGETLNYMAMAVRPDRA